VGFQGSKKNRAESVRLRFFFFQLVNTEREESLDDVDHRICKCKDFAVGPVVCRKLDHADVELFEELLQIRKPGANSLRNCLRGVSSEKDLVARQPNKQVQRGRCQVLHLVDHEVVHS